MRVNSRLSFIPGVVVVAVALSGCGSSGSSGNGEAKKTGPEVVKDAAAALGAAGAAHLAGTETDSSTKKPVGVDLQLQNDATSGTVTIAGSRVNIVAVGGADYINTTAAFYEQQGASAAAAAKIANRWVKVPSSSDFDSFTLAAFSKDLADPSQRSSTIEQKVATGKLNGQKVVIVSQADGSQLFVAATGKPYPLKVVDTANSKDGAGTLTFTGYGKHVAITAPAGAVTES